MDTYSPSKVSFNQSTHYNNTNFTDEAKDNQILHQMVYVIQIQTECPSGIPYPWKGRDKFR